MSTEYKIFNFPTKNDDMVVIERHYCSLLTKYREQEILSPEEMDWMDTANTWLQVGN